MIIVGTYNIRNQYKIRKYDGNEYSDIISEFINGNNIWKEQIDIIGLQEVRKNYLAKLTLNLKDYMVKGKYRHRGIFSYLLERINESNNILIRNKFNVLSSKTIWLSPLIQRYTPTSYLSLLPRIATVVTTDEVIFINTHIHFKGKYTKMKQLNRLIKYVNRIKGKPVILMGDFNIKKETEEYKYLVQKLNLEPVEVIGSTHKKSQIDHIFYSKDKLELVDAVIDSNLGKDISDHNPVLAKFNIKNT